MLEESGSLLKDVDNYSQDHCDNSAVVIDDYYGDVDKKFHLHAFQKNKYVESTFVSKK